MIFEKIQHWFHEVFSPSNYNLRTFATFLIVIMLIQYIPVESRSGVSMVKVSVMMVTPFVLIPYFRVTKAAVCVFCYFLYIFGTSFLLHPHNFRASTVIYLLMFLLTYVSFYNFVWVQKVFKLDKFIQFLKNFIFFAAALLVLQQCFILVGIPRFPLINLADVLDRGIGANSLFDEPSHFARIISVLYYAYLKCNEYESCAKISLKEAFGKRHRWVTVAFLWSALSMGSGTAFICLGILSLYFMKGFQFIWAIPIFAVLFVAMSFLEIKQMERAVNVVRAGIENTESIETVDGSAAVRIKPILNTFHMDLSNPNTWIGRGCDTNVSQDLYSEYKYVGEINDYGLIAYILGLILVFSCAINFRSLATIMFFVGVGGGTANISYQWGILMVFTCVKYFYYTEIVQYGKQIE